MALTAARNPKDLNNSIHPWACSFPFLCSSQEVNFVGKDHIFSFLYHSCIQVPWIVLEDKMRILEDLKTFVMKFDSM